MERQYNNRKCMSLAELSDQYHVQYDNKVEDAFVLREWNCKNKNNCIKFRRQNRSNLYNYKLSEGYIQRNKSAGVQLVETVTENQMNYSNEQFKAAQRARRLYHAVGAPRVE